MAYTRLHMDDGPQKFRFVVTAEQAGLRLDQALAAAIPDLSRRRARLLLDIGGVFVDRTRVKVAGRKVREGQVVEAVLGNTLDRVTQRTGRSARDADRAQLPEHQILHVDSSLIVAFKPAGLLTAPTPESDHGNLLEVLRNQYDREVHTVHRLDLQTSGVLVFARTEEANRVLGEAFRVHAVERQYIAVVSGEWPEDVTVVESPVAGKSARSHVTIERRLPGCTMLGVRLDTGRTHQVRIHCADTGHPVLGDPRYGRGALPRAPRMALHATKLGFTHPDSGAAMTFDSPLPPELASWVERLLGEPAS